MYNIAIQENFTVMVNENIRSILATYFDAKLIQQIIYKHNSSIL